MADSVLVETIYGKYSKFEVVKKTSSLMGSPAFYVRKDGKPHKGSFSSLKEAVESARRDAG
jgi:hypothetical protein